VEFILPSEFLKTGFCLR